MAGAVTIDNLRPNRSRAVELTAANAIVNNVDNRWDAANYVRTPQDVRGITILSTAQEKQVKVTDWGGNTITITVPDKSLDYAGSIRYLEFVTGKNPDQIIFHYIADE